MCVCEHVCVSVSPDWYMQAQDACTASNVPAITYPVEVNLDDADGNWRFLALRLCLSPLHGVVGNDNLQRVGATQQLHRVVVGLVLARLAVDGHNLVAGEDAAMLLRRATRHEACDVNGRIVLLCV